MWIPERDTDGNIQFKNIIALNGYHYEPRSLDFVTSKYKSLYNRKNDGAGIFDGTDYNDASLKFFDSSNNELIFRQANFESETEEQFQTRLDSNCVKTYLEFIPDFDYAIKSGIFMIRDEVLDDCYFWCVLAPHIQEEFGGSVPFLSGGYNMRFFSPKSMIKMDGITTAIVKKDNDYFSHKIGLFVKHNLGQKIGTQMIYELYKK